MVLSDDGLILENATKTFEFNGSGPDKARQEASHPHGAFYHALSSTFVIPDLGSDKIRFLRGLSMQDHIAATKAGDGPRHIVFQSNGAF